MIVSFMVGSPVVGRGRCGRGLDVGVATVASAADGRGHQRDGQQHRKQVGGQRAAGQRGNRAAVEAMLAGAPYVRAGLYASVEIHDWQFGGRHQG
jgi:hypothetical protein